jgi:hypothetical protein
LLAVWKVVEIEFMFSQKHEIRRLLLTKHGLKPSNVRSLWIKVVFTQLHRLDAESASQFVANRGGPGSYKYVGYYSLARLNPA